MEVIKKMIEQAKMGKEIPTTIHFDSWETYVSISRGLTLEDHEWLEFVDLKQMKIRESDINWDSDESEEEWSCNEETEDEKRTVDVLLESPHINPLPIIPPGARENPQDMDPPIIPPLPHEMDGDQFEALLNDWEAFNAYWTSLQDLGYESNYEIEHESDDEDEHEMDF